MSLFDLFGYQSVLNMHIIVSRDFQRKIAKKRSLYYETIGTNTGLNMKNRPGVGRRLGVNDIYVRLWWLCTLKEGGASTLNLLACIYVGNNYDAQWIKNPQWDI